MDSWSKELQKIREGRVRHDLETERKQGLSAEQVPVSAYGGSLKNLKDLKRDLKDLKDLQGWAGMRPFRRLKAEMRLQPSELLNS